MAVKRRGGHLQRMDPLRGGKYDPLLGSFYSRSFSFHFISSAPHSFGIARDSSHLSGSNRIVGATDWSNPTAISSFRNWTVFRSSQFMRSSPGMGVRCGCMCEGVWDVMIPVPSSVCRHFSIRSFGYCFGYFYLENALKPSKKR
jgi:hypothetical protein